jgi:hypothetical protein
MSLPFPQCRKRWRWGSNCTRVIALSCSTRISPEKCPPTTVQLPHGFLVTALPGPQGCSRTAREPQRWTCVLWSSAVCSFVRVMGVVHCGQRRALWVLSLRVSNVVMRIVTNAGTVSHTPHAWSSVAMCQSEGGPSDRQPHRRGVKPPSCTSTSCHGRCTLPRPLDAGLSRSRDMLSPHRS